MSETKAKLITVTKQIEVMRDRLYQHHQETNKLRNELYSLNDEQYSLFKQWLLEEGIPYLTHNEDL